MGKFTLKGYVGGLEFDDSAAGSADNVNVWMGEIKRSHGLFYIAGQVSGWIPEDNSGNGLGMSADLLNPGLGITQGGTGILTDQDVTRYQIALGHHCSENMIASITYFVDDYAIQGADTSGGMFAINGRF